MIAYLAGPYRRLLALLLFTSFGFICLLSFFQNSLPSIKRFDVLSTSSLSIYFETAVERDPPTEHWPYGALIVASQSTTDLSWSKEVKENWEVYKFDVNQPNNPDIRLQFPKSKGHEAMIYLSFIIDNYENLPWCAIFMHGHREAWHQETDLVTMIRGLDRAALARTGYISLRCDWYPSCPAEMRPVHGDSVIWGPGVHRKSTEAAIAGNWKQLFPGKKLPTTIAAPCCAQFAVSRQAIRRRPKTDYERLRNWLLGTLLQDDVSGRVLEKLWAYIFLEKAVHCPPPQQCSCEYFQRCSKMNWTQPPAELGPLPDWP